MNCEVCGTDTGRDRRKRFCSRACSAQARRTVKTKEIRRYDGLPKWGETWLLEGEFFKIGHLGKVYRWGISEWMTTETTEREIRALGQHGRFWNGEFIPVERAA